MEWTKNKERIYEKVKNKEDRKTRRNRKIISGKITENKCNNEII